MAAFKKLPKESWLNIPSSLARVGDPAVVPKLQQRLREIDGPAGLIAEFTDAIYSLSQGDAHINTSFQQGVRFAYPYDGPGIPNIFTVNPVNQNWIKLPKADAATDDGRSKIWQAFSEQTSGPGFTIDRDEIVLLHGLRAIPVNTQAEPLRKNLDKWICETPAADFVDRFDQPRYYKSRCNSLGRIITGHGYRSYSLLVEA